MSDCITIVAGLGRCGSSMVMQMLAAGGHPIFEPHVALPPSYENPIVMELPNRPAFLMRAQGSALKLLDPHRHRLPPEHTYRIIWCDRNRVEQAKSSMKFLAMMLGVQASREDRRRFERSLKDDAAACMRMIYSMPNASVLRVRFEDVIRDPLIQAQSIAMFVGLPGGAVPAMANCVVDRSPKCLDGMIEFSQLAEAVR